MLRPVVRKVDFSALTTASSSSSIVARRTAPSCFAIPPRSPLVKPASSGPAMLRLASGRFRIRPVAKTSPIAAFHTTSSVQSVPLIPLLLGTLKSASALQLARTLGRISFTLLPFMIIKKIKSYRKIGKAEFHNKTEEQKKGLLVRLRRQKIVFNVLLLAPPVLFILALLASLERTPLTGRWRAIILSPEEEDDIAAQLAGPGWFQAIHDILVSEGSPPLLPSADWRYMWVQHTLRRLESTIPVLQSERDLEPEWLNRGFDDPPLPPPADYPLRPRPRGAEYIHRFTEELCERSTLPSAHAITGPPYSLVVVEKPDVNNAFSYGFGPDGAGGIVVYSGFLDEILSKVPASPEQTEHSLGSSSEPSSWWSFLFGGLFPLSRLPDPPHPVPTSEQTSELAILLAHELAHLILSHHIESLSSGTVIIPGVMSMLTDVVRALLFPITMVFGPFVNDAVGQIGKIGSGELIRVGEYCTSVKQEVEADVVSARLLAHAGFDARDAVRFWERRQENNAYADCALALGDLRRTESKAEISTHNIMGSGHPVNEVRVKKLRAELSRWASERESMLQSLRQWEHDPTHAVPVH